MLNDSASRAYSASISIAGSRVLVYNSVLRFASNTSTCYIEAQPGREFRVEYSSLRPKGQVAKTDIAVALDVDGVRLGMQRIVRCFDVDVGEQRIARFEGHRTSSVSRACCGRLASRADRLFPAQTTIQPFVLKACSTDPEKPGKIELKFYRVKIEGVNLQPKFIQASGSTSYVFNRLQPTLSCSLAIANPAPDPWQARLGSRCNPKGAPQVHLDRPPRFPLRDD